MREKRSEKLSKKNKNFPELKRDVSVPINGANDNYQTQRIK